MRSWKKWVLILLVIFVGYTLISNDPFAQSVRETLGLEMASGPAPTFNLPTVHGGTMSLAQFQGKPVMLIFWTTWCPSCRTYMNTMAANANRLLKQGVVVLGISLDDKSTSEVASFVTQKGLAFPVMHDRSRDTGDAYGVRAFPTTFLIDRTGNIVDKTAGGIDWTHPKNVELINSIIQ